MLRPLPSFLPTLPLLLLPLFLLLLSLSTATTTTTPLTIPQPSFEASSAASPWGAGFTSSSGQKRTSIKCRVNDAAEMCPGGVDATFCTFRQNGAAPFGVDFATVKRAAGGGAATKLLVVDTGATIEATTHTYRARVWARGLNAYWGGTKAGAMQAVTTKALASVALTADGVALTAAAAVTMDVGAPIMKGDARTSSQDDGANVWLETVGGKTYRIHTGGGYLVQEVATGVDPVTSPWTQMSEANGGMFDGMAKVRAVCAWCARCAVLGRGIRERGGSRRRRKKKKMGTKLGGGFEEVVCVDSGEAKLYGEGEGGQRGWNGGRKEGQREERVEEINVVYSHVPSLIVSP